MCYGFIQCVICTSCGAYHTSVCVFHTIDRGHRIEWVWWPSIMHQHTVGNNTLRWSSSIHTVTCHCVPRSMLLRWAGVLSGHELSVLAPPTPSTLMWSLVSPPPTPPSPLLAVEVTSCGPRLAPPPPAAARTLRADAPQAQPPESPANNHPWPSRRPWRLPQSLSDVGRPCDAAGLSPPGCCCCWCRGSLQVIYQTEIFYYNWVFLVVSVQPPQRPLMLWGGRRGTLTLGPPPPPSLPLLRLLLLLLVLWSFPDPHHSCCTPPLPLPLPLLLILSQQLWHY